MKRYGWRKALCGALMLFCTFFAGVLAVRDGMRSDEHSLLSVRRDRADTLQNLLARTQIRLSAAENQIDRLMGERAALETVMAALRDDLRKADESLSFYETLFPAGPSGAVSIRNVRVSREGDHGLRYRVLLSRVADPLAQPFSGTLRFVAHGRRGGKPVKMELKPWAVEDPAGTADQRTASPGAHLLALKFDHFQRSAGLLRMIPELELTSVHVQILEGGLVRDTRRLAFDAAATGRAGVAS